MYLEGSLLVVVSDAVVQAGPSVEAVADVQDGGEQGAGELVADFNGQLDRLCGQRRPCQDAVTWRKGDNYTFTTVFFVVILVKIQLILCACACLSVCVIHPLTRL